MNELTIYLKAQDDEDNVTHITVSVEELCPVGEEHAVLQDVLDEWDNDTDLVEQYGHIIASAVVTTPVEEEE